MKNICHSNGFALPTVMIASIVMLLVMLSAVVSTVAIRSSLKSQYYNKLAQTSADAGLAYAKACLKANGNVSAWDDTKPLKPNTDCSGNETTSCPDSAMLTDSHCSVFINDKAAFSFTVGETMNDASGKAVSVNAVGITRLYRGSGASLEPWRQYSSSELMYTMPKIPITAIGAITGTAQMGQVLTAGAITPAGATVSYQWQSSATSGGTYTNISGATASTYTPDLASAGKYLKVVATGTGTYIGTQTSAATSMVTTDSNWVIAGTQVWAAKNLNVGTMITGVTAQTNNSTPEKYCYNDTESSCTTYGGLYRWDEAMNYSVTEGAQGICPVGSHIPSDAEWKTLEMSLSGMAQATADSIGFRGTDEDSKLEAVSGLNVPFAGFSLLGGTFSNQMYIARLWSSSVSGSDAWARYLDRTRSGVSRDVYDRGYGYSIRCLRN